MTPEQHKALNFLASCPIGHTTLLHDDVQSILLETGGNMLACGRLYDIVAKPIGAGVYKVSLTLSNP